MHTVLVSSNQNHEHSNIFTHEVYMKAMTDNKWRQKEKLKRLPRAFTL